MKLLNVYARVLGADQTPQANLLVQLEQFDLARAAWTLIAEKKTTRAGNLTLALDYGSSIAAPWLRLSVPTPNSSQSSRPLAHQAYLSFNEKTGTLTADFGEFTLISGDLPTLSPTQKQFNSNPESVLTVIDQQWLSRAQENAVKQAASEILAVNATPTATRASDATFNTALNTLPSRTSSSTTIEPNSSTTRAGVDAKETTQSNPIELGAGAAALDAFTAELIRFRARESQLATDLQQQQLQLGESQQAVKKAEQLLESREIELAKLAARAQTLESENAQLISEAKAATPISNLADNIGHQIEAANAALARDAQPYRVQNVQLEVRGNLLDAGNSISFAHAQDSAAQQAASSVVRLDLVSQPVSASSQAVTLPDLSGLTQTAVERLLGALGLKLKALAQPLRLGDDAGIGQALRQAPAPKTAIAPHSTVTVVFASAAKEYL